MKTLTALLLFALAAPASASVFTGNDFLRSTNKPAEDVNHHFASGFFVGVMSTYIYNCAGGYCVKWPEGSYSLHSLRTLNLKYLTDNPAEMHRPAEDLMFEALEETYGLRPVNEDGYCLTNP